MKRIRIKSILTVLFFAFSIIHSHAQINPRSEKELRRYYKENILKLDPIEGIYDMDVIVTQGSNYLNPSTKKVNTTRYIYKSNDGNFRMFNCEMSDCNVIIQKVGDFNVYNIKHHWRDDITTSTKITLQQNSHFSLSYSMPKEEIKKDFGKKPTYGYYVDLQETYFKTYPTQSMYSDAQTEQKRKEQQALEEAAKPKEWTGTGFALKNGYIVTNNHVVDGAKSIVVLGIKGNTSAEYKARVIGVDKNNDLALIKIDDYRFNGFASIPYAVKNTVCEVGSDVFVLGYPLTQYMGDEVKLTNGIISSKTGYQGDITTYQISAPIQPGNSGGPMFDSRGNVVGIVNAGIPGAENVGYAIKTSYLYNLVSTYVSPEIIPQINSVTGTSLADKVKQVKNCVFFIKCKAL